MAIGATTETTGVAAAQAAKTAQVPTWVFAPVPNDTQGNRESNQAVALLKDGKPQAALDLLRHALSLPKDDATDVASLYNRAGVALNRLGDQAGALEMFRKAGSPPAIYNEGVSTLKVAIAQSGQGDAFATDKSSVDASRVDGEQVRQALALLSKAVSANGEFFTKMAREDTDWAPLVKNVEFRAIVGLPALEQPALTTAQTAWGNEAPTGGAQRTAAEQLATGKYQKSVGYGHD